MSIKTTNYRITKYKGTNCLRKPSCIPFPNFLLPLWKAWTLSCIGTIKSWFWIKVKQEDNCSLTLAKARSCLYTLKLFPFALGELLPKCRGGCICNSLPCWGLKGSAGKAHRMCEACLNPGIAFLPQQWVKHIVIVNVSFSLIRLQNPMRCFCCTFCLLWNQARWAKCIPLPSVFK